MSSSEPEEGELTDDQEESRTRTRTRTETDQNNHSNPSLTSNQTNLHHHLTPNQTLQSTSHLNHKSPSFARSSPSTSALPFSNSLNTLDNQAYAPANTYSVPSTTGPSSKAPIRDSNRSTQLKPSYHSRHNQDRDVHQSPSNLPTRSDLNRRHGKSPRHPTSSPHHPHSSYQTGSRPPLSRSRPHSPDRWRPSSRSPDRSRLDQSPRDRRISPSRFSSPPPAHSPHLFSRAPTRSPRRTPTVNSRYRRSPSRTSYISTSPSSRQRSPSSRQRSPSSRHRSPSSRHRSPSSRYRSDRPPSDSDHHHLMPRARRRSRSYTPERSLSRSRSSSRDRRRSPSRPPLPLPPNNGPIFSESSISTARQQLEPIGDPEKPQISVISSSTETEGVQDPLGQQGQHPPQENAQPVQSDPSVCQILPQDADQRVDSSHEAESHVKPSEPVDQIDGLTLAPSDISSPRINGTHVQNMSESTSINHDFTYTNYDQAYSWKREPTSWDVPKRTPKDDERLDVDMDIVPANVDEKPTDKLASNPIVRKHFIGVSPISAYELIEKLGEGTFGEVYKATYRGRRYARKMKMDALTNKGVAPPSPLDESSDDDDDEDDPDGIIPELGMSIQIGMTVAVKRIIVHNELDGLPITSLREIRILKSLQHPNVVPVVDIAYSRGSSSLLRRGNTYMVFPYIDHDLAGLMENKSITFSVSQIKLYSKQLLLGTAYLHRNKILHRDLKAANLLISNAGQLLIADFGLARSIAPGDKREYTNCVVTRWYRPPEILLGDRRYGTPVDMWGVGCVIGEMFKGGPILTGSSDVNQCELIFRLCGSPTTDSMPGWESLPGCEGVRSWPYKPRRLREEYHRISSELADLLDRLLVLDASKRLTAEEALDHDWFWTDPMAIDPAKLQHYEASHEYDRRKKDEPAKRSMQNQFDTFTGLQPITPSKPTYPPPQGRNHQAPVMNPPPMRSDVRRNQVPPLGNPAHPQTSFLPGPSISYPPPHHGPTGSLDPHSLPPPLPQSKQPVLQMHNTYPHQPPGMMSTQGLPLHSSQGGGAPLPYRDGPNPYGQPMNTNLLPVDGYKMPHQNPRSGNMAPPTSSAHDHHHQPRNSRNLAPSRPPQFHQLPGPPNLALPPRPMLSYVETGANEPIPHKTSSFHNNLHQPNMPLNPLYGPPGILNGPPAPAPILTQSAIGSMNHNNREFDRAPRDTYIPGGGPDGYPNHMRNGNGPRNQNERRYHRNHPHHPHHPHQNPHQNLNNLNGHDRWTPSNSNQPSLQRERGEYRNRGNEGRRGGGGGGGGGNRGSWSMNSSFNNGNGEYIQGGLNRSDHEWSHSLGPPPPPPSHPNPNSNSNSNLPPSSNPLPNQNGIEGSVPLIRYVGRPQDDGPHLEY